MCFCMHACVLYINSLISISSLAFGPMVCMPDLGYDSLLLRPSSLTKDVAEIHTAVVIALFRIFRVYV